MGGPMTQPPSDELFVSGLPTDVTDDLLKKIFSQYGSIKEVKVLPVAAGKQAAAAFVDMNSLEDAKWIVENVNGNVPQGMAGPVTVAYATPRSRRKGMKGGMKGMMEMMAAMMSSMSGQGKGGGWGGGDKGGWGGGEKGGGDWGGGDKGGWGGGEKGGGGWAGGDWGGSGGSGPKVVGPRKGVGAPVVAKGWSSGGKGWSDGAKGWGTSGKGWGDSGGAGKGWGASGPVTSKGWGDASGGWGSGGAKGVDGQPWNAFPHCEDKILDWPVRREKLLEILHRSEADVICLQEVTLEESDTGAKEVEWVLPSWLQLDDYKAVPLGLK
ncbi:SXL, partial [Symbiodinium necroappetens]